MMANDPGDDDIAGELRRSATRHRTPVVTRDARDGPPVG